MTGQTAENTNIARRNVLKGCLAAALLPVSKVIHAAPQDRRLTLYGVHTGEFLDVVYFRDGAYDTQALAQINHTLRDHRENKSTAMDVHLIDWLHHLHTSLAAPEPFRFISGYRTQKTNNALRAAGRGAAKRSYHLTGRAIDIFPPGVPLSNLVEAARQNAYGGVGQYTRIGFVHLDTGPARHWVR